MKQFSIATCMVAVLFMAIGSAALTHPTELWASSVFTLVVGLLCWASIVAVIRRRAIWVGSAIFGWACLILSFGLFKANPTQAGSFPPPPPLLTASLMNYVERRVIPGSAIFDNVPHLSAAPNPTPLPGLAGNGTPFTITYLGPPDLTHTYFHQIGHSLMVLLVAIAGGFLAGIATRDDRNHRAEPASEGSRGV